jgi:hypothetical protein
VRDGAVTAYLDSLWLSVETYDSTSGVDSFKDAQCEDDDCEHDAGDRGDVAPTDEEGHSFEHHCDHNAKDCPAIETLHETERGQRERGPGTRYRAEDAALGCEGDEEISEHHRSREHNRDAQ